MSPVNEETLARELAALRAHRSILTLDGDQFMVIQSLICIGMSFMEGDVAESFVASLRTHTLIQHIGKDRVVLAIDALRAQAQLSQQIAREAAEKGT